MSHIKALLPSELCVPLSGNLQRKLLSLDGAERRVTMILRRFDPHPLTLEQRIDRALELEALLGGIRLPDGVQDELLAQTAHMQMPLVVAYPDAGGVALISAPSRAALLDATVLAVARALAPLETTGPAIQTAEFPDIVYCSLRDLSPDLQNTVDRRRVLWSFGPPLVLAPSEMLQAAESCRGREHAAELWAFAQYADAAGNSGDSTGYADVLNTVRAVYREYAAEPGTPEVGTPEVGKDRPRPVGAHQLVGSPAAPGRAVGAVVRFPSGGDRAMVLVCDRLDEELLREVAPVAVVERLGGSVGIGAQIAADAGIPCVSGVADAVLLTQGSVVRVDGSLGLVTVDEVEDA